MQPNKIAMPLFFADECVAALIVKGLRSRGFDVVDAKEICQGDTDERAVALAAAARRVLDRPAAGVIILVLYSIPAGKPIPGQ